MCLPTLMLLPCRRYDEAIRCQRACLLTEAMLLLLMICFNRLCHPVACH